jgi:hypothetical protein
MQLAVKHRARQGTETRQRQRRLTYRITEAEYAEVEAAASAAGLTLASYARARTVAAPTTGARRRASVDTLAMAKLLAMVSKTGANLYQLVRHLNFGGIAEDGEIRAILQEYRAMIFAIMAALEGP